ncbi:MAG TPA: carotenoid biosynthesis protein [Anaerolineae bacterium]|nr:carotenoid biosynthesis protein [Anaerolineae bacterium]
MARRVLLSAAIVLLALFSYDGVLRPLFAPLIQLPAIVEGVQRLTLLLTLFSLTHAALVLGWRHSLIFFALSAVIAWGFEQVGVETGAIYGRYHYTEVLGPKLGHVPFLIPLAWFMMIYPSYVIANLIADKRPAGSAGGVGRIAWLAFLSGMVMTAWDLVVDPILSGPNVQAWVWEDGGPYFGIPVQNYVGWMLTTFTVYLVYRLYERRAPLRPIGPVTPAVAWLPLLAYGAMLLSNVLRGDGPEALIVIAPFVMGLPLVAAIERLVRNRLEIARQAGS